VDTLIDDLLKVLVVGLVNPCVILIKSSDYHDNFSGALRIILQPILHKTSKWKVLWFLSV